MSGHIKALRGDLSRNVVLPELRRVVCIGNGVLEQGGVEMQSYSTFTSNGHSVFMNDRALKRAENAVTPEDVLNLQFTSGMSTFVSISHIIIIILLSRNHRLPQSSNAHA
jgi:pilus assembly protein TadC